MKRSDRNPDPPRLDEALAWRPLALAGELPLLLIRHGQTAWNQGGRILGRSDVPLDAEGRAQANLLANRLRPVPLAGLYTSPLVRARQTAEAIATGHSQLQLQIVDSLVELDPGAWEGLPSEALLQRDPDFVSRWTADPGHTRIPGGETLGECQLRALTAIERIARAHAPGPPVAIVTHKLVLSSLICAILGLPLRYYSLIGQNNAAINLVAWRSDGTLRLVRLNEVAHLEPLGRAPTRPA